MFAREPCGGAPGCEWSGAEGVGRFRGIPWEAGWVGIEDGGSSGTGRTPVLYSHPAGLPRDPPEPADPLGTAPLAPRRATAGLASKH